jgi:leucine dehydrogenase
MEELIRQWDGECVVVRYDGEADAWMFIAIHSRRLGPASGGTRMKVYDCPTDGLRDAQRLAEGMTYKWACADFPQGGGKGVIALSRPLEGAEREALLERYGRLVDMLGGNYGTGADLGVGPDLVEVIARSTKRVFGMHGAGDPGPWTALGTFVAIQALARRLYGSTDLNGRTVLVQGLGGAGRPLCERLVGVGARLKVTDVDEDRAKLVADALGATAVKADDAYNEECDIFAPCAVGGILNESTIPSLKCAGVAGCANNQLEEHEDADRLHERGILYSPDFVNNAGGAIALCGMESLGMNEKAVEQKILSIGQALDEIFQEAGRNEETPLLAAEARARRVLERGPAKGVGF